MVFLMALADAHVPAAKDDIPERLRRLLQPGKISIILCLGNCGTSVIDLIKKAAGDIRRVAGDEDDVSWLPDTMDQVLTGTLGSGALPVVLWHADRQTSCIHRSAFLLYFRRHTKGTLLTFDLEGVRVGMCHGHTVVPKGDTAALDALRRRLGADVLFTAATGQASVCTTESGLLINPGSVTGASSSLSGSSIPSYVVVAIEAGRVLTWVYQLMGEDDLRVDRSEWTKAGCHGPAVRETSGSVSGDSTGTVSHLEARAPTVGGSGNEMPAEGVASHSALPAAGSGVSDKPEDNVGPASLEEEVSGMDNAPAALSEADFGDSSEAAKAGLPTKRTPTEQLSAETENADAARAGGDPAVDKNNEEMAEVYLGEGEVKGAVAGTD